MIDINDLRLSNGAANPVIDTRMDKLPWMAVLKVGRTLKEGMKYERDIKDNWKLVPANEHLNHALRHIANYQSGDRTEDHVGHAATRILMWAELECQVETN